MPQASQPAAAVDRRGSVTVTWYDDFIAVGWGTTGDFTSRTVSRRQDQLFTRLMDVVNNAVRQVDNTLAQRAKTKEKNEDE